MLNAHVAPTDCLVVNVPTAQKLLGGISREYIYVLIRGGELETAKAGRRRLVFTSSIRSFLERQRVVAA